MLEILVLAVIPGIMLLAATTDTFTLTIPNKLNFALVGLFFLAAPLLGLSLGEIAGHAACALAMLMLTFILFTTGAFGGGDAKFASAVALWLGPVQVFDYAIYASLFGGLITALIVFTRTYSSGLGYIPSAAWMVRLMNRELGIPYGIALSGAAVHLWPQSIWYQAALPI